MNREDLFYAIEEEASYQKLIDVLRAVVELHKPHHGLADGGADSDGVCLQCSSRKSEQFYPCPTIQAIEKELK